MRVILSHHATMMVHITALAIMILLRRLQKSSLRQLRRGEEVNYNNIIEKLNFYNYHNVSHCCVARGGLPGEFLFQAARLDRLSNGL